MLSSTSLTGIGVNCSLRTSSFAEGARDKELCRWTVWLPASVSHCPENMMVSLPKTYIYLKLARS